MELFSAFNISKQFSGHKALDKVSISIPEGSIFGLLGPNGAGKTTFIRIINQIIAPDEGQLFFNGRELKPNDIYNIGYLPEERGLYKKMTVGEQSMYLAQLKGLSKHEAQKRLLYWFEKFEMRSWWNKKIEELSKGMQQKVQFLITIIHEPKLLIFDEPFSGFDPVNTEIMKREILNLRDKGATIIFSTHNMETVEDLCENISLVDNAKIVLHGSVAEIRASHATNTFIVGSRTSLNEAEFNMISQKEKNGIFESVLMKDSNETNNVLLKKLLNYTEVLSFEELLPSMNDIFLKTVKA